MIRGLREKLGLSDDTALDDVRSPKTQMALALGRVKSPSQIYGGTVPPAEKERRRTANKSARRSRRTNRGNR
jgi:hypothetical protein